MCRIEMSKHLTKNTLDLLAVLVVVTCYRAPLGVLARTGAESADAAALPHPDGSAGMHLHVLSAVGDATGTAEHAVLAAGMTFEEGRGVVDVGAANEPG